MAASMEVGYRNDLILRLKRIEGQLRGLQKMIDSGEECEKIGQQMSASRKALDRVFYKMMACMLETHAGGDRKKVKEITELIARLS